MLLLALALGAWTTPLRADVAATTARSTTLRSASNPVAPAPRPATDASAHLHAALHHGFQIPVVAWRPDGRELAVVESQGRTVRLWDIRTGRPSGSLHELDVQIETLAYSPDGQRLAATLVVPIDRQSEPNLLFWDMTARRMLKRFTVPGRGQPLSMMALAYRRDGRALAIALGFPPRVVLYDVSAGALAVPLLTPGNLGPMEFDPSGQLLAYVSDHVGEGFPVKIVRLADGSAVTGDLRHRDRSHDLVFDPAGRRLAVGDSDGAISVYDVPTGRLERRMHGHAGRVRSVRYLPGGDRLVSAAADGIRVWSAASGAPLHHCRLGGPNFQRVVISPTGDLVATGGPNELYVWDVCAEPTNSSRRDPG